jgi:hypothetical protein
MFDRSGSQENLPMFELTARNNTRLIIKDDGTLTRHSLANRQNVLGLFRRIPIDRLGAL